ncbi:MAG: hypothetical protein AAFY65_00890 [Pseudomonadota bacterium]
MAQLVDLRAQIRAKAKTPDVAPTPDPDPLDAVQAILAVPMIAAAAMGKTSAGQMDELVKYARTLPGLVDVDVATVRSACTAALDRIRTDGAKAVFDAVAPVLTRKSALSALLLASDVAYADPAMADAHTRLLRPMGKRLKVGAERMDSVLAIARRRRPPKPSANPQEVTP